MTTRRTIVKGFVLAPLVWSVGRFGEAFAAAERAVLPNFAPLGPAEWKVVDAVVDLILPRSAGFPSGTEAGVGAFLRRGLASELPAWRRAFVPPSAHGKDVTPGTGLGVYLPHYRELATRLNAAARKSEAKIDFGDLKSDEQASVWRTFTEQNASADVGYRVAGAPSAKESSDAQLYDLVRRHATMGFLSEPTHGGNKDYAVWEALGHVCHLNYPKAAPACAGHTHTVAP